MSGRIEELELLLLAWEDGTLDDDGLERLRGILRTDEAARSHFLQMQMLTAALRLEGDAGLALPDVETLGGDAAPAPRKAPRLATGPAGRIDWRRSLPACSSVY